jgi:hypothetical protein
MRGMSPAFILFSAISDAWIAPFTAEKLMEFRPFRKAIVTFSV